MADSAIAFRSAGGEVKIATDLIVDPTFGPVHLFRVAGAAGGSSGGLTDTELRAAPLEVNVDNVPHIIVDSMPASGGGLTNTELRAAPVPVSGPLTDTQLRANPIAVSGTFWQATQPVSGPLTDTQLRAAAVPVSGPLTDTQLRASAVPVSGPLTDTQLRASAVPVSGPLTDTQLRASAVQTTALTDTQLRANPVPVSSTQKNRLNVSYYAEAIAGVAAEALINMNRSINFAAPTTATAHTVTSGKVFRLLGFLLSWVATTTTANSMRLRLRVNTGGAATLTSQIALSFRIAWESATFIANEAECQTISIPEGIDIPGAAGFALTQVCAAANGTFDISAFGYEYTP